MDMNSVGDCWETAWADDGTLYSNSDDSKGFTQNNEYFNLLCNQLVGDDPDHLTGTTVNTMAEYGTAGQLGPDGCCWKAMGAYCLDGTLYMTVARHNYGMNSGDPQNRQRSMNASVIRSYDGGKSWVRSAQENYDTPMFPGLRFGTPYFIKYGQDGAATADNANRYVYAISNDGFWDNGNNTVLGRVLRSKLRNLDGQDWEYFVGGDGMADASWSPRMEDASLIVDAPGRCGMTGAQYIAPLGRYLMIQWHYTSGGGQNYQNLEILNMKNPGEETAWDFYEAPAPWGPWTRFQTSRFCPMGFYNPCVLQKFISDDGRDLVIFTNGNFHVPQAPDPSFIQYRLAIMRCRLIV